MNHKQQLIIQNRQLRAKILQLNEQLSSIYNKEHQVPNQNVQEVSPIEQEIQQQNILIAKLKRQVQKHRASRVHQSQTFIKELKNELAYLKKKEQQVKQQRQTVGQQLAVKQGKVKQLRKSSGFQRSNNELKQSLDIINSQNSSIKQKFINFFRGIVKIPEEKDNKEVSQPQSQLDIQIQQLKSQLNSLQANQQIQLVQVQKKLKSVRQRHQSNKVQLEEVQRSRREECREAGLKQRRNKNLQSFYKKRQKLQKDRQRSQQIKLLNKRREAQLLAKNRRWEPKALSICVGTDD